MLAIPLIENTKFTNFPFHVFDRYEIHIHDVGDFIEPVFIICRSPSSQNLIQNEVPEIAHFQIVKFQIFQISNFPASKFPIFKLQN